jgi:hypothetical protein
VSPATGDECPHAMDANYALQADMSQPSGTLAQYSLGVRLTMRKKKVVLGVSCLYSWCEIGRALKSDSYGRDYGTSPSTVKVREDEQVLSDRTMQPMDSASIVPADNLGGLEIGNFAAQQKVATITLRADPVMGSKQYAWGLKAGDNYVWVQNTGAKWTAWFTQGAANPSGNGFRIDRVDHSALTRKIPGVARWVWLDGDEEAWIACAQGCCTISGDPQTLMGPSPEVAARSQRD